MARCTTRATRIGDRNPRSNVTAIIFETCTGLSREATFSSDRKHFNPPRDVSARERPLGRWRNGAALHKGNVWKDASHDTDSLINCIRLLRGKSHGPLLA